MNLEMAADSARKHHSRLYYYCPPNGTRDQRAEEFRMIKLCLDLLQKELLRLSVVDGGKKQYRELGMVVTSLLSDAQRIAGIEDDAGYVPRIVPEMLYPKLQSGLRLL